MEKLEIKSFKMRKEWPLLSKSDADFDACDVIDYDCSFMIKLANRR